MYHYQTEGSELTNIDSSKYTEAIALAKDIRKKKRTRTVKKESINLPDGPIQCLGKTALGDNAYKFVPYCLYNANKKRTFDGHATVKVEVGEAVIKIDDKEFKLTPDSSPFVIPAGTEHHISRSEDVETIVSIYTSKELVLKN